MNVTTTTTRPHISIHLTPEESDELRAILCFVVGSKLVYSLLKELEPHTPIGFDAEKFFYVNRDGLEAI